MRPEGWGLVYHQVSQPLGCPGDIGRPCWDFLSLLSPSFLPGQAKGNPESSFNDENLRMVVVDLFTAGMVTTATTLTWALLLMILYPDVQREPGWGWEGGRGTLSR